MSARGRRLVDGLVSRVAAGDRWLALAMVLLVGYYVATPGVFQGKASGDGWFELQYLRAFLLHGTLDMTSVFGEYGRQFGHQGPFHFMPNRWPIGPVIFWLPTYLLALLLYAVGHLILPFWVPRLDGSEPFFPWLAGLGTVAAVLWGWRALYILLQRSTGSPLAARLGAIVAVWCTPLAWYTVTQPMYQHGVAFAVVAVLIEYWERTIGRRDGARFVWLGALGGLAAMMRPQEVLYLLPLGGELLMALVRGPDRRRALVGGLVLGAVFLLVFSPQLAVWYVYSGAFHPAQQEPLRFAQPFIEVVLFSTRGGLFPWTPLTYLSCFGLLVMGISPAAARLRIALLAVFAVELYVIACAWTPTAGYAFGARRLSDGALLLGLGAALAFDWTAPRRLARRALFAFVTLCLLLNVVAMELMRTHIIASSGSYPHTPSKMLEEARWPPRIARLADYVGYPFVQPVGWLFALYHHVPVATFEGVVGGFVLERDPQFTSAVALPSLVLDRVRRANAVAGLDVADKGPARVTGPARLLIDMFAKEPFRVDLVGKLGGQPTVAVRWNECALTAQRFGAGYRFEVPIDCARAGTNDVALTLPVGAELKQLDFASTSDWFRRP